ncbi:Rsr1p [Lipomyces arxii]|uniref:Rsr1p n=1 Tax=Lipomyces arxii TaxID=56418 RepID=UPI0034CF94F0
MSTQDTREYRIVVLGAGGVGKSALTVQFAQGVFLDSYDPTIEDSYRKQLTIDGRSCVTEILDTAGVEQFTAMRELYIKNGEGFLLVYSVTDRSSLAELEKLFLQIMRIKDSKDVPIVLVGNKSDLAHARTVPFHEAKQLAHKWGTSSIYETSARTTEHVDDVFIDLVRQIQRRDSAMDLSSSLHTPEESIAPVQSRIPSPTEKHSHSFSVSSIGAAIEERKRSSKRSSGRHSQTSVKTGEVKRKKNKKKGGMCAIL